MLTVVLGADATRALATPASGCFLIATQIDRRSHFEPSGNQVYWYHFDFAGTGLQAGANTTLPALAEWGPVENDTVLLTEYLLDPQIEETVRNEIGNLPPSAQQPVVLTTMEIRRYFRKLVELELPHLAVLSYQELSPEMNSQPLARIRLG